MDLTWLAASGFIAVGVTLGVLLEHWLLWWLLHRPLPRPWRRKSFRSPGAETWPLAVADGKISGRPHAGHLVQRGSVAAGPLDTPGKRQFRVR